MDPSPVPACARTHRQTHTQWSPSVGGFAPDDQEESKPEFLTNTSCLHRDCFLLIALKEKLAPRKTLKVLSGSQDLE